MENERQQALSRIFADVLEVAEVGADDNFFDLGGNSIMAMKIVSRVRDELDGKVTARLFYRWPTIAGLDQNVEFGVAPGDPMTRYPE
ncbi:phosphopantetheine-binding protein [Nonomuraea sp. NPDC047529]|uniref:phosphopantetheine-binding protein n=1 Tax=Nonomuraea sp. NPDC047529 TaxID=3155623 RepID=UPI0033C5BA2D